MSVVKKAVEAVESFLDCYTAGCFTTDFPAEALLKFKRPFQWITLVYEEDLLQHKYQTGPDATIEYGYQVCEDPTVAPPSGGTGKSHIISQERFADGQPHLQFQIDDQDRRQFTAWNMRQLANVISMTSQTWDMEIASVLYFQPDPVGHIFDDKYNVGDIQPERMLDAVSKILQDMEENELEERPYQRLYMLLQQFDLLYLYRRMFMNFNDKSYIDPNLPYGEIEMLNEMAQYGEDAPLQCVSFRAEIDEWGWAVPLSRQIYGDVANLTLTTKDGVDHCLTINVTGIYENRFEKGFENRSENGFLTEKKIYRQSPDTMIPTIVMWLKEHDQYFREHFVRASFRYATRREIERENAQVAHLKIIKAVSAPRKFVTMDNHQKFLFKDHLNCNPIIHRKAGYWTYLREVHKNQHSANKMLYLIMPHKNDPVPFRKYLKENEDIGGKKQTDFFLRQEIGKDPITLQELQNENIFLLKKNEEDFFPENFQYDPKEKLKNGLVPHVPEAAMQIPTFWQIFRIHRLLRWGCPASICAGALMVDGEEFYEEKNAPVFHKFPIVEVGLNICEISEKNLEIEKLEILQMLTRLCQCKFTLRQINFYNGMKTVSRNLTNPFLEIRIAASVCLTQLQEFVPENRKIIGRDEIFPLLLDVLRISEKDNFCFKNFENFRKKNEKFFFQRKNDNKRQNWKKEIFVVAAAQAANAIWLALRERTNRFDFVRLNGIEVCTTLLSGEMTPDYATIPVIGILSELANESEFHHKICESGALAAVCKVLQETETEDVFQNACCLISLICDCDEAREIVRVSKSLDSLLKPLKLASFWSNQGCMQMATAALYKTAISSSNCEFFCSKGAIDLALDRIYEGVGETIVFQILGFLAEMVRLENCRQTIRGNRSLPFIMDFLLHNNQFIRMKAAVITGRMGADKESYLAIVEANGIVDIWNLMNKFYDPLVGVHACMAIYPLFVANPKETARIIRTIVNPFGPLFGLLDVNDARLTDAVMSLICLLSQDDDLLAIMSDVGFCLAISRHIETKDLRLLQFVMEAIARGSEYAINRTNFSSCEGVLPAVARNLWHSDEAIQNSALDALHELTKYPQNIIQIHSDPLVRRLLGYLMEGSREKAKKAAGCLRHMRYLAMANMGDVYNFEDVYFPVRSEEKRAIDRTKRELLLKKIAPEAKMESDKMKTKMQKNKREKMKFLSIPPTPPAIEFFEEDRQRLPEILLRTPFDPKVPRPVAPSSELRTVNSPVRKIFRDPTHLRQDRPDFDRDLQNGAIKDEIVDLAEENFSWSGGTEWWKDPFNEENYNLFNRLTIKNNFLSDNIDKKTVRARPQNFE